MSSNNSTPLYSCSRCFSRHPFEELSPGEQLCKECRGTFPVVKCTYCRSEFQQTSKSTTSSICKKCEASVKAYGKPTACEYCNIIAAFIGNKCQRCTNSERKYGAAVSCEQCKQRCAFDRHDDDKKGNAYGQVEGKLLCWLCTQSLKRALARTKQTMSGDKRHKHRSHKLKGSHKDKRKSDVKAGLNSNDNSMSDSQPPEKKSKSNPMQGEVDPNSSDHVVAMTQLKETIASLQKQITQKDQQLLTKDKMITELKAQHFTNQAELRNQMKSTEKLHETKCGLMSTKIQTLLREVATLNRSAKKSIGGKKSTGTAENSGSVMKLTCAQVRALVDDHNAARELVARGQLPGQPKASNMKRIIWDEELAAKAEGYVVKGVFQHNTDKGITSGRFITGENLFLHMTTAQTVHVNVSQATGGWFNEHHDYKYGKFTRRVAGSKKVGHYTQMVWANTTYLGCAISNEVTLQWNKLLYVCYYGPAGNYMKEYPYETGAGCENMCCGINSCANLYGSKC